MSRRVPEFADVYAPFIQIGSLGTILLLPSVLIVLRTTSSLAASEASLILFVIALLTEICVPFLLMCLPGEASVLGESAVLLES